MLGGVYTFVSSDRAALSQAKRESHGYIEPESRLSTALFPLAVATAGFFVFGFVAQNPAPGRWVGLEFGLGMIAFGLMQAPSIGFTYVIEGKRVPFSASMRVLCPGRRLTNTLAVYNSISGDCLLTITLVRSVVAFAWTFFVGTWVESDGAYEPFSVFGALMAFFTLLTIPMMLYGKRTRIATAKWLPARSDH